MKKISKPFLVISFIFICLILVACGKTVEEKLQKEAVSHFKKNYSLDVRVTRTQQVQMQNGTLLYLLDVDSGSNKYNLFFDESNKPLADNFNIRQYTAKNPQNTQLSGIISEAGFSFSEEVYYDNFSYDDKKYFLSLNVNSSRFIKAEDAEKIAGILPSVKNEGIETLNISVMTPDFLKAKPELSQKDEKIRFILIPIKTNASIEEIKTKIEEANKNINFDEEKFKAVLTELSDKGIKNTNFYLTQSGSTQIALNLYGESSDSNAAETAKEIISKIDKSYINIGIRKIRPVADIIIK